MTKNLQGLSHHLKIVGFSLYQTKRFYYEIEQTLNAWYAKGYRLHTCSISHTDSKGFAGGDRLVATCILEKI